MFDKFLLNPTHTTLSTNAFDWFDADSTFEKLSRDVDRVAFALFRLRELKPGLVGLWCHHPYQHWVFILALARVGLASASLPVVADTNFHRALSALRPDILITDQDAGASTAGRSWLVLNNAWFKNIAESGESFGRVISVKPDDVARVSLAGAADATPQRISMTYRHIEISVFHLLFHDIITNMRAQTGYRVIPTLSSETPSGFLVVIAALMAGACVQIASITHLGLAFTQKTPCIAVVSPSQAEFILSQLPPGMKPLENLYLTVAAGNLPLALYRRICQSLTPNVQVVYGSDECGPVAFGNPAEMNDDAAVGYVVPWVSLEIVGIGGTSLGPGMEGEIRLTGTGMIVGYDDNPHLTERKFRDGWFYPGDRGVLNERGVLKLSGRSDDLVSLGGDKFDLPTVDAHIRTYRGVRDSAMFIVANSQGMPEPWVALVTSADCNMAQLSPHLRQKFPNLPDVRVVVIEKMPRDGRGSVDRAALLAAVTVKKA